MTNKIFTSAIAATSVLASLGFGLYIQTTSSAQSTSQYKLPYPTGKTYELTYGNCGDPKGGHCKGTVSKYAWDFGLPKGSDVVATRAGTVRSLYAGSSKVINCNQPLPKDWYKYTNYVVIDHGDGNSSLYAHLTLNSVVVKFGDQVSQGQKLGTSGETGYTCGPHLHYAVEKTPSGSNYGNASGGYWTQSQPSSFADSDVIKQNPNGVPTTNRFYKSDNGNNFNPPPGSGDTFQQPNVSSTLSITVPTVDLNITASNLSGKTVYVQMWRPAINGNPEKTWNYSKNATGTSITFNDLEGPGNTFSGVDYYTVASLSPIPSGEAAQRRTGCYLATNRTRLCDTTHR